eukprot:12400095-Karenia_brevis.AAC.1
MAAGGIVFSTAPLKSVKRIAVLASGVLVAPVEYYSTTYYSYSREVFQTECNGVLSLLFSHAFSCRAMVADI